jgi:hypothetical protein
MGFSVDNYLRAAIQQALSPITISHGDPVVKLGENDPEGPLPPVNVQQWFDDMNEKQIMQQPNLVKAMEERAAYDRRNGIYAPDVVTADQLDESGRPIRRKIGGNQNQRIY